jgi:protein-S-isoprenylcysteine O-methyltransferase Ste14
MTLALKALAFLVLTFVYFALILFLAAGTLAWPAAWIYLILLDFWVLLGIILLLKYNPGLLQERLNLSQSNQKTWDKVILVFFQLFLLVWTVLMPLDAVRFHWSRMPLALQVVGAVAMVVSCILISLVFRENSYLSGAVRIQEERGHTTISTGPYHYVRHPMYAGGLLLFLSIPLLLGSWYGLLAILLFTPVFLVRAVLEERTLRKELPGYDAYMAQVKYRLIPHVW